MSLTLFNSLGRKKEPFVPLEAGRVRMYHCGPTVYKRPHVGNYRAFLFADFLRRVLERRGYVVTQVMNVTDVGHFTADDEDLGEDSIEREARATGKDPWQVAREITEVFEEDLRRLRAKRPEHRPRATDHVPEMLEIVAALLEKGVAYRAGPDGQNVYFEVSKFPRYGDLSGNRVDALDAGARVEVNPEKRHPADFALWKSDPKHLMQWPSAYGPHGFPGWHIECSAMARKYLGDTFDLHTGGEDLIFPHHECEVAQSEAATGKPFVKTWLHVKFLLVDGGKMSKRLGNVWTVDDVVARGFEARHLRFLLQRAHYRTPLNFTWDAMTDAKSAIERLEAFRRDLAGAKSVEGVAGLEAAVARARAEFDAALDDDLNASAATAALFSLVNEVRGKASSDLASLAPAQASALESLLVEFDAVFDVLRPEEVGDAEANEIDGLVSEREAARARRDFARADALRDELARRGIVVEDRKGGARWRRG